MKRIALIGAPGSGKTTLTTELFTQFKILGKNVYLVPEYARDHIDKYGPPTNVLEQYKLFLEQTERENLVPQNVEYAFHDTMRSLGYFYVYMYLEATEKRHLQVVQDMYKFLLEDIYLKRYDHIFYLPLEQTINKNPNILNDGTRYQTKQEQNILDEHMNLVFNTMNKMNNIITINAKLEERCKIITNILLDKGTK